MLQQLSKQRGKTSLQSISRVNRNTNKLNQQNVMNTTSTRILKNNRDLQ